MAIFMRKFLFSPSFCSSIRFISASPVYSRSSFVLKSHTQCKNFVCSMSSDTTKGMSVSNENDQISNLRAQEVEFEPSRAQDVFQNAVEEVSNPSSADEGTKLEDDKEHLAAYQCATNVHLNAVMQSMVPDPFTVTGKAPVHLNMPGGTWSRGQKYLADHRTALKDSDFQINQKRDCHTSSASNSEVLTQRQKFKLIIKDYGSTVVVFHIGLSLCSVGAFYLAVSSGLDVAVLLDKIGLSTSSIAVGGSTFVVAYAVHKVFAPVRIAITLSVTPFIVRYLRSVGILKVPQKNT